MHSLRRNSDLILYSVRRFGTYSIDRRAEILLASSRKTLRNGGNYESDPDHDGYLLPAYAEILSAAGEGVDAEYRQAGREKYGL